MEVLIAEIVESVFKLPYTHLEQIIGKGKNNQVFKLKVSDGFQILRLSNSPQGLDVYEKERWCAQAVREAGINTPAITHVGTLAGYSYSFQEYIEGTPGTEADEEEVWFKLGQVARTIHKISASHLTFDYAEKIGGLFLGDFCIERGLFSTEVSNKIKSRLNEAVSWEFTPMLCHGNLHPSNVILASTGSFGCLTGKLPPATVHQLLI